MLRRSFLRKLAGAAVAAVVTPRLPAQESTGQLTFPDHPIVPRKDVVFPSCGDNWGEAHHYALYDAKTGLCVAEGPIEGVGHLSIRTGDRLLLTGSATL